MITIFLSGGLGNQMFQYASGKVLAEKTGTNLLIDLSLLNTQTKNTTPRSFGLGHFVLDKNIKIVSSKLRGLLISKLYFNLRNTSFGKKTTKYFSIFTGLDNYNFSLHFSQVKNNVRLIEYSLSEKYLLNYKHVLQNSFIFKEELDSKNNELAKVIKNSDAVSIHIRQGDYLSAANYFVSCSKTYYEQAIAYICEKVRSPQFFIFSDEPQKAKELLCVNDAIYVDWNKDKNTHIDMRLMSLCKHNIIANSSFSWWGAWLNKYPEKIVIAPHKWFVEEVKNDNFKNLIPQGWVRL